MDISQRGVLSCLFQTTSCFNPFSAGIDFRRQIPVLKILFTIQFIFFAIKASGPRFKYILQIDNDRRPII